MDFSSTRIYKGFQVRFGAREVAPGLYEPVADTQSLALESASVKTELGFDRRWLMSMNDAIRLARRQVEQWVDAQKTLSGD